MSVAVVLRAAGASGPEVVWSGFEFVCRDCGITRTDGVCSIDTNGPEGTLALRLRGRAGEWPIEVSGTGTGGYVSHPVRITRPGGTVRLLVEKGAFDGTVLVRTGLEMELIEAELIHTTAGVPAGLSPLYDGDMFIYENRAAVPKGMCVAQSLLDGLGMSVRDAGTLATGWDVDRLRANISGRVTVRSYEADRVIVDVLADEAGILLFQDTWYPGWKATLDGVETPILQTGLGIRAVAVPRGCHEISMEYRPGSFRLGLGLSLLGILFGVLYGAKTKKG
jgi:hypothetical protein